MGDESSARFVAGASPRHSAREVTERRGVASGVTSTREVTEQISPRHSVRRDAYHVTQHHTTTQPAPEVSPAPVSRTSASLQSSSVLGRAFSYLGVRTPPYSLNHIAQRHT